MKPQVKNTRFEVFLKLFEGGTNPDKCKYAHSGSIVTTVPSFKPLGLKLGLLWGWPKEAINLDGQGFLLRKQKAVLICSAGRPAEKCSLNFVNHKTPSPTHLGTAGRLRYLTAVV